MYEEQAKLFKVFSDPNRVRIIELLIQGETCSCTLIDQLPISQPTLSYHLKMISDARLATSRKEGTWIKYYINQEKLAEMCRFLTALQDSKGVCKTNNNEQTERK